MVKNTLKLIGIIILAWIVLPTGPTDLFFIPYIVSLIGWTGYIILSAALIIWLYMTIPGKTLGLKLKEIKRELRL